MFHFISSLFFQFVFRKHIESDSMVPTSFGDPRDTTQTSSTTHVSTRAAISYVSNKVPIIKIMWTWKYFTKVFSDHDNPSSMPLLWTNLWLPFEEAKNFCSNITLARLPMIQDS